ncbi:MFS transporter [Curtobacterium flaccumfaciens]|nr:MFS transporter [Curtobacterium flaccumfaciens]
MSTAATRTSLFSGRYALATVGMVAIVAVAAFQNLAMTTIMPEISRDLDGETLYALAFAAPLAAGVPGMVLAGNWTDRAGGRVVAWVSAGLFALGTAVVMTAPTMAAFLVGRLVEGFGAGAIDVVLYVLVARIFPEDLHGPVFAGFAAAWVVPALIGPALAGIVTDLWNWHWVFAGALVIAVGAFTLLVPTLGRLHPPAPELRPAWQRSRIGWSVAAAVAILLLNVAPDLGAWAQVVAVTVGLVGTWFALRPLLPVGTFRAAPGLPSVILSRGLVAALVLRQRGVRAVPAPGEGRPVRVGRGAGPDGRRAQLGRVELAPRSAGEQRLTATRTFGVGLALVLVSLVTAFAVAAFGLPWWLLVAGWFVGGAGMGAIYPRTSMLTLRFSGEGDDGFASSALTIADASGSVIGLAVTGLLFIGTGGAGATLSFPLVFGGMTVIAVLAAAAVRRLGPVPAPSAVTVGG